MAIFEVIEFFDESGEIMVVKIPQDGSGEFVLGSQLVVQESQLAAFYRDGRSLDMFSAGRHTLSTQNLPLLGGLIGAPFGQSPFRCYVYFISTKTFVNQGWGTATPVNFRDSELRMVQLRANGSFSIRIVEPRTFLQTIVGTMGSETTFEIQEYIRSIIVSKLNATLGKTLDTILDLPVHYNQISLETKQDVRAELEQYGIQLVDLVVEAITPPQEVQERMNQASGIAAQDAEQYGKIGAIDALRDAAKNPGGSGEAIGAGLGLGMGVAMGNQMGTALTGAAQPAASQPQQAPPLPGAASAAGTKYKVAIKDQEYGPYGLDHLQEMADDGSFKPDMFVWAKGMGSWTKASEVSELSGLFGSPPLPAPADDESPPLP